MLRALALLILAAIAFLAFGYRTAVQMPVERKLDMGLTDWPAGAPPMRVVLLSDLHVVGPDTPPERIARVVARINALEPDLVLIAGDLLSYRDAATRLYSPAETVAPLKGLRAKYGVVAVPGNHDYDVHGRTTLPPFLEAAGVTVLRNQAVRRGALTIAGADDIHPGQFRYDLMDAAARKLPGPTIVLSHSPDIAAWIPPRYGVVLAGHTHCGQIAIPFYGPVLTASHYGQRFGCGLVREGNRLVVVTAGIGSSVVPLRYFAPPDFWVLTLGPVR